MVDAGCHGKHQSSPAQTQCHIAGYFGTVILLHILDCSSAVSWRCGDPADCLPQAEVTLYLVSSAALGGYLTSAALFVLSSAPASPSLCSYWVACTMQYNCQMC